MSSTLSEAELSALIWKLLKEQGCVHPLTAKRVVMVHEHDIKAVTKKLLTFIKTSS